MPVNNRLFNWMFGAVLLLISFMMPTIVQAKEVTSTVDSTMTVELQQTAAQTQTAVEPTTVAQTGDAFMWFALGVLVLVAGFAFIAVKSRSTACDSGLNMSQSNKFTMITVAVLTVLIASAFLCMFVTKSFAEETDFESKVGVTSHVVVDEQGKLVSSEITATNERASEATVLKLAAPDGFIGWSADISGQTIQANSKLEGSWQGEKIPESVLKELKEGNKKIELTCSSSVSFNVAYDIEDVEVSVSTENQVYSASQKMPDVEIEGLVEGDDYEVEYGENVEAGEGAGTITIKGIGFWEGEKKFTFDILKKPITASWSDLSFTYDQSSHKPTATAEGLCSGDTVSVTVSGAQTNAGTHEATATINETNYEFATAQKTNFTIGKKPITVEWSNTTFTYDKEKHKPTANAKDLCTGDSVAITVSGEQTDVGTYEATATISETNYEFATAQKTSWLIGKKAITVDWSDTTFTYDKGAHKPTATANGLCDGDSVTITVADEQTNAGTYEATATISEDNYEFATAQKTSWSIGKKAITVDWSDTTFTYDKGAHKPTATAKGLCDGDSVSITVADEQTNAGTYEATATISETNYEFATAQKTNFTIGKKPITVEWSDTTFTYDKEKHKPTANAKDLCTGDSVSITVADEQTNAGTYEATATISEDNYEFATAQKTSWSIGKKAITVDWSDTTFTYDKGAHKPTAIAKGLCDGDSVSITVADEQTNAGTYEATATISEDNYEFATAQKTSWSIGKKAITVDWSDTTFTYDKGAHKPTATAKGLCDGDSVTITVADEQTNAGDYEATATISETNYEFATAQTTSWSIGKKQITATITATASNKVYDGNATATITKVEATFATLAGDDALSLKSTYTANFADKNVATDKLVTLSNIEFEGASLANYNITSIIQETCKATISAKTVTVSGLSVTERAYVENDTSATLAGTAAFGANDICSGDTVTIGTVTGAYADANAADDKDVTLTIPLSGADAGNYTVAAASKTLKGNILAVVKFVPNAEVTSVISDKNPHDDTTITDDVTAKLVTKSGVKFDGWYDNIACSGTKWDFSTDKVSENVTTLYANWVPDSTTENEYWLAPAMKTTTANASDKANVANPNYSSPINNVKKTAAEIQADVKKINNGDSTTIAEYKKYMTEDNIHLYTKYGTGDGSSEDDYAEFRIIEVSGAAGHETTTGGGDGSVITFMAAHTLPSVSMMVETTNKDGWPSSYVYSLFQPNTGSIYNKFKSGFTDDIVDVKKEWVHGNTYSQTETPTISTDRLWLLSYSEIVDGSASGYFSEASKNEGTRYEWFKNLGITASNNAALTFLTRAGVNPTGESGNAYWWLRSSNILAYTYFLTVNDDGLVRDSNGRLGNTNAMVPCFSFGANRTVKFDNQGHGNDVATQYDVVGDNVTEPTAAEVGNVDGLTLEGWYTDSKCSADKKWNFSTDTVSDHMTLYANWVPNSTTENEYWLAPAMKTTTANTSDDANKANSSYTSPTTNVKKTASEIQADVKKISEGDATTIAEYKKYMTEDNIHLYTKYTDANSQGTEDNYVEFRIIEVGNHDGKEALTFQATHVLPTAARQIASSAIVPTWDRTELAARMNDGDIFKSFSTGFTDDIMNVTKASAVVNKDNTTSASYKLWLPSYVELSGGFKSTEGTQYDYYKQIGITYEADNPALAFMTRQGNVCTSTSYSDNRWWTRSSPDASRNSNLTYMVANAYSAGALQVWAHYYAYNNTGVAPCFAFGMERTVKFDNCGHGNNVTAHTVELGGKVTAPDVGTAEGLTLEGWYTDPKFTAASKWNFDSSTVTGHMTLYANWVVNEEESAYWLAPAMGSSNYVSETSNVLKSESEIQADVVKLKAGDATVTAEYEGYMSNNSYHLYTRWNGSGNTGKNAFVEFQIVSVGKHYNIEDDESSADGSCVTFMASYLLPGSYQMRASGSNNGGWPSSDTTLRISMNEGGDIYNSFDSGFTSDITPTSKRSQITLSSVSPTQWGITSDKLWVVSYKEFTGHDNNNCTGEGLGYSNVPNSVMKTREGSVNGWWLRTIKPDKSEWCFTTDGGAAGYYQTSSNSWGVAPCFSF